MFASLLLPVIAATLVNASQVDSGEFIGKQVSIRGVVSAVVRDDVDDGFNWIRIKTPEGTVSASTDNKVHPLAELQPLLDAEVELTGVVQRFTQWRKNLGCQMLFDNPERGDRITVISPAPEDPFAAAELANSSGFHRQTASGTVAAVTGDSFFLRRESDFIHVKPADIDAFPSVGSSVTVSGFAEPSHIFPLLIEAIWRTEPKPATPPEPATDLPLGKLFRTDIRPSGDEHRYADPARCGQIVRLTGRVESVVHRQNRVAGLRLESDGEYVFIDLSGFRPGMIGIPEQDATIAASGFCFADFDTSHNMVFPRFLGFSVIPRNASDIEIIRAAPFWTPRRLIHLLTAVFLVAIGFAVWSVMLRRLSIKRGHELAREQIRGARAELKVEERTRLAVELHDSISQTLTGVALQIDAATAAEGEGAKTFLATARNMLSSCRQELNGCLWDLRSRTFEEKDMTEAVQRTLAPHVGDAKLTVRFNVPRERLSEQTAHAVLRIIRELGTNAVKHGHAKNVKIAGEFHDDTISFSVTDDGKGFDTTTAPGPAQGHFGLQGVRERLNEFNGTIRCDSEPGCGAKFTVTLHTALEETE